MLTPVVAAESEWNPFRDRDDRARTKRSIPPPVPPPLSPMDGVLRGPDTRQETNANAGSMPPRVGPEGFGAPYPGQPQQSAPYSGAPPASNPRVGEPKSSGAAIADLAPVMTGDNSGMPADLWNGLDIKQLEDLIAPLQVPPRSVAMHSLWTRLFAANATPPTGGQGSNHFLALQLEVLYRSGRLAEMNTRLDAAGADATDPLMTAFRIRSALAANDRVRACEGGKVLQRKYSALPKGLASELALLAAYCAAAEGNLAAAGLAADLARDEGVDAPLALAVVDALVNTGKAATGIAHADRALGLSPDGADWTGGCWTNSGQSRTGAGRCACRQ